MNKSDVLAELSRRKYRIEIRIKNPIVITDEYVKKPSKDNILEMFGLSVQNRMLDEKITITISEVTGK